MIRSHRQRHVRIALVLAVLVPALLGLAWAARRESLRSPIPFELLDAPVASSTPPARP